MGEILTHGQLIKAAAKQRKENEKREKDAAKAAAKAVKQLEKEQREQEKAQAAFVRELQKIERDELAAVALLEKEQRQADRLEFRAVKDREKAERQAARLLARENKKAEKEDKWAETMARVRVADFETTTLKNFEVEGRVRVFMFGHMAVNGTDYQTGTTVGDFMKSLEQFKNPIVLFHNLSFDGSFIESYLLESGVKFKTYEQKKDYDECAADLKVEIANLELDLLTGGDILDIVPIIEEKKEQLQWFNNRSRFLSPYQYQAVRDKMRNVFKIDVCFEFGNTITFMDSLKWFPGTSIDKLGKTVGVAKIDDGFDHMAFIHSYKSLDYKPTEQEWKYMNNDVTILQKVVEGHLNREKRLKLTRTGYAFTKMTETYNEGKGEGEKFKDVFPPTDVETWKYLKPFYNGGLTIKMPDTPDTTIHANGITLDVNSLYPYVMQSRLMPFGDGITFDGDYDSAPIDHLQFNLYVQECTAKFSLKPGMVPSLSKSFTYASKSVLSDEDIESGSLFLTCVDLKHFFINYDVTEFKAIGGYAWRSVMAPFKDYIDKEMANKVKASKEGNELARYFSKLNMNAPYGYLGKSIYNSAADSMLDDKGVLTFDIHAEDEAPQQYIPAAIFIAAWARDELLNGCYAVINEPGCTLHYMDTDSMHFSGETIPASLRVHADDSGAWSIDARWHGAKFLRPKTYVEALTDENFNPLYMYEKEDGKHVLDSNGDKIPMMYEGLHREVLDIKGAGLTADSKAIIYTMDDLSFYKPYPSKSKKSVPGGTLILDITKTLKPDDHKEEEIEELKEKMVDQLKGISF